MSPPDELLFLTADWVLPVGSAPLPNGVVVVKGERIEQVLSQSQWSGDYPPGKLCNYGPAVIMPGLINLHTHLDYTKLGKLDGSRGMFAWVKQLMAKSSQWQPQDWQESANAGAAAVALSGTSCVADSSYTGSCAASALAATGLRAVVGLELFGLDRQQVESAWSRWLDKLETIQKTQDPVLREALSSGRIQLTIAPHAPYTVCPQLWQKAVIWARRHHRPILCHLSESTEECRFIAHGDPVLQEFLNHLSAKGLVSGLDQLDWNGQNRSPVAHLDHYQLLNDLTLAAHLTHTQDGDLAILSRRRVKLAHCPRSNAHLGNGTAPLAKWLKTGLTWGFGTDSLASNADLDLLNEAGYGWSWQRTHQADFTYEFEPAVYALTLGAAEALHLDKEIGSLEPGKYADIAVFKTGHSSNTPYNTLLTSGCRLQDLFVSGRHVVKSGQLQNRPAAAVSNSR